ncbi:hypothetical protein IMY05_012G0079700 [Salix suchowensis]|nr:hypothetical protein IMY05_012G0079700 [Salix suchowensis]
MDVQRDHTFPILDELSVMQELEIENYVTNDNRPCLHAIACDQPKTEEEPKLKTKRRAQLIPPTWPIHTIHINNESVFIENGIATVDSVLEEEEEEEEEKIPLFRRIMQSIGERKRVERGCSKSVNSCEERPKLAIKYSIDDTVQQRGEGEGAFI